MRRPCSLQRKTTKHKRPLQTRNVSGGYFHVRCVWPAMRCGYYITFVHYCLFMFPLCTTKHANRCHEARPDTGAWYTAEGEGRRPRYSMGLWYAVQVQSSMQRTMDLMTHPCVWPPAGGRRALLVEPSAPPPNRCVARPGDNQSSAKALEPTVHSRRPAADPWSLRLITTH